MIWQAPYGLHICSAHGRHMTLLCGNDLAITIWVAHMVTICIPYGKHVHMNTIWEAYDIAIGVGLLSRQQPTTGKYGQNGYMTLPGPSVPGPPL